MEIRLKEPQRHRAFLVDPAEGRDQFLQSLIEDRGFIVVSRYPSLERLLDEEDKPEAGLVIIYAETIEEGLCEGLRALRACDPRPVLLISQQDDPEAIARTIDAGASAFLPIGISTDRFRSAAHSAMAVHSRIADARQEAERLKQQLEERKAVERAKGILMEQRGISERDAFREIQLSSMRRNIPMPEVARSIIEAKELLG